MTVWVVTKYGKQIEGIYMTEELARKALAYKRWAAAISGMDDGCYLVKEMAVETEAPQVPDEYRQMYYR